jgi:hypothetical protein
VQQRRLRIDQRHNLDESDLVGDRVLVDDSVVHSVDCQGCSRGEQSSG